MFVKKFIAFLALSIYINTCTAHGNIKISLRNDTQQSMQIYQITPTADMPYSIMLENGAGIEPHEELSIGTNIRSFVVKHGNQTYRVKLPRISGTDQEITLTMRTIQLIALGISVTQVA